MTVKIANITPKIKFCVTNENSVKPRPTIDNTIKLNLSHQFLFCFLSLSELNVSLSLLYRFLSHVVLTFVDYIVSFIQ